MKPLATQCRDLVLNSKFLYRIDDDRIDNQLVAQYARFKLGDPICRAMFVRNLARLVSEQLPDLVGQSDQWNIVTPATTELAQDFANELAACFQPSIQFPVVPVGPDPHPDSDYTHCSADQRRQIVESFYDFDVNLSGKKIIVIDDFVNTGTALSALVRRLVAVGASVNDIHCFVFVQGNFANPSRESDLVTEAISQLAFDDMVQILCDPAHIITSATMLKYLVGRSESELQVLARSMTASKLATLRDNITNYYRAHPLPNVLKNVFINREPSIAGPVIETPLACEDSA